MESDCLEATCPIKEVKMGCSTKGTAYEKGFFEGTRQEPLNPTAGRTKVAACFYRETQRTFLTMGLGSHMSQPNGLDPVEQSIYTYSLCVHNCCQREGEASLHLLSRDSI